MTKLYEANNHILIRTGYIDPEEHCHMAAHIIIATEAYMDIDVEGTSFVSRGVMIPSGKTHAIDTKGKPVLVFLYDSTSNVANYIQEVRYLSDEACESIVNMYHELEKKINTVTYDKFESNVLNLIGFLESKCRVTDERITSALKYIKTKSKDKLTCKDVADVVFLSESRFSHLFKEQVGMTFAAYVIYQRIVFVYAQVIQGKSITEAALNAGFSSSAHFADVNKRVFGLTARSVLKDLEFVKV